MPRMTDEEAANQRFEELSDEFTRNPPKLGPNGTGFLSQREFRLLGLQEKTINYLMTKARELNKSPYKIIHELVCKEIVAKLEEGQYDADDISVKHKQLSSATA